nr:immunoglobulin light chain junction region [Macaca mulatta]MOW36866.1 immunoglobulin light chain junction region [Macaca mulatta]MOW37850.1 immunoglobulin light chain junction region [Macaca mulatta]MOW38159.1 immunoglobulin light chain junction region [Macaca mulatta]
DYYCQSYDSTSMFF